MKSLTGYLNRNSLAEAVSAIQTDEVKGFLDECKKLKAACTSFDAVVRKKKAIGNLIDSLEEICHEEPDSRRELYSAAEDLAEVVWERICEKITCLSMRVSGEWKDFEKTAKWFIPYINVIYK